MSAPRRPNAHGWWLRAAGCLGSLTFLGPALGATLSSESSLALTSEYNSNPSLVPSAATPAESAALLATVPVSYTRESQSFDLVPQLRLAETHGDAQLLTDYQYLDADWHLDGERDSLLTSAAWHRDSTFYNVYENAALRGRTLPRLEDTASLAWHHELSERSNLQFTGSWDQVGFSSRSNFRLENYNYVQGSLEYDRALTERWNATISGGFGRYDLRALGSSNENRFLQGSVIRALSERWSMTLQLGYSLLNSRAQAFLCCGIVSTPTGLVLAYIPIEQRSSGGTIDYALSAERKSERLVWDFAASRSTQPSGLGALLTQDDVRLSANFPWTERLTVGATLHGSRLSNILQGSGGLSNGHYYDFGLNTYWLCTEHWTLALQGSYNLARANERTPEAFGNAVSLTLTRQFGRIQL